MQNNLFMSLFFSFLLAAPFLIQAHSHHHDTYIVEQPVQTVVVVQQPPIQPVNLVTVESEPPAELYEVVTQSPGENFVWQKGHWQWNGSWVWVKGGWIQRPVGGGVYVPGHWRISHHHPHHWVWEESYWKK